MKASRFACLAVLTGAVALLAGCSTGNAADTTPTSKSLQLRVVVSQVDEACSAPPLTTDAPATACGRAGTTTYQLAKSLGTITPTSTALGDSSSSRSVTLQLDETDTSTLAAATRKALDKQMAIILDGKVLSAPQVMEPLTTGDLLIAFDSASTARQVNNELHAHNTH